MAKILIDARMYGLEHAGIGRYLINLIDNLKKVDYKNSYIILLREKYFNKLNLPSRFRKVSVNLQHYTLEEQLKLPRIVEKEEPDIVHFPHFNIPIFYRGPFIVTIHDMIMHTQGFNASTLPLYKYYLKRIPYKIIFRKAVCASEKIIVPSNSVKREIVNYYKVNSDKVVVTYEGFGVQNIIKGKKEIEILSKYKAKKFEYFFYVGNAYPHKNLENAIKAVLRMNVTKNTYTKFLIAGSRDIFRERLQNMVEELNAQDFIKLLGFVEDKELWVLYKNSLGFLYPSLSEGFGLQGLEAIASGTLLLASNIPVFKEIFGEHAFFFNPNSIESISRILYSVMKMKKKTRLKHIKNSRKLLRKYSWRKMTEKTLQIYNQLLK